MMQVILETVDALFLGLALCLEDAWSVHNLDGMEGGRLRGGGTGWGIIQALRTPPKGFGGSFFSEAFGI